MKNDIKEARKELLTGYYDKMTICETLRRIYDLIENIPDKELKEKITDKLITAITMTRKMSNRLIYYRNKYNDTTGKNSSDLELVTDFDEIKKLRLSRKL